MDATIVQEIANQLGMAVDATSEWLSATLPLYAGYRTAVAVAWTIISAVVVVVSLLAAVVLYRRTNAAIARENEGSNRWKSHDWFDHPVPYVIIIALAICAVIFLIPLFVNIDALVRWSLFPEGATLDMVLKAVQR